MRTIEYTTVEFAKQRENRSVDFLLDKLLRVRSALCTIKHDAFVIQSYIIQTLSINADGSVYFLLFKPVVLSEWVEMFNVNLIFYRKNFNFYIEVNAVAQFETAHKKVENLSLDENGNLLIKDEMAMVKARITSATYHELKSPNDYPGLFGAVKKVSG